MNSPAKPLRIEVIDREYAAFLALKTPAERLAMAEYAHRSAQSMVRSRIAELYPNASKDDLQTEFLRRMLGNGTAYSFTSRG
jgi:hypothetical protein